jgi:predicted MFS family arabinose efflux permease
LSAGGLGGVFYPLIILYLGPAIGFPWAVRVIGFFNVVTGVVGCLLVRKRLPPNKAKGAAIDLKALREPTYAVVTLASFLLEFTLVTPYTYISTYAIAEGMDPQKAYMLTTILSAAGFPGRIVPNYFADRYGVFNVMILTAVACIASIFGLWLNAHRIGDGAIIAFAVLWAFGLARPSRWPPFVSERPARRRTTARGLVQPFSLRALVPLWDLLSREPSWTGVEATIWGVIIMSGVLYVLTAATYFWAGILVKKGKTRRL